MLESMTIATASVGGGLCRLAMGMEELDKVGQVGPEHNTL